MREGYIWQMLAWSLGRPAIVSSSSQVEVGLELSTCLLAVIALFLGHRELRADQRLLSGLVIGFRDD